MRVKAAPLAALAVFALVGLSGCCCSGPQSEEDRRALFDIAPEVCLPDCPLAHVEHGPEVNYGDCPLLQAEHLPEVDYGKCPLLRRPPCELDLCPPCPLPKCPACMSPSSSSGSAAIALQEAQAME